MRVKVRKNETYLDLDLLFFYLGLSVISFGFYIIRHPLILAVLRKTEIYHNISAAYAADLVMFLGVLVPYIIGIIILIVIKLSTMKKIPDAIFVIMFFPILSFFTKGMSLLQTYAHPTLLDIIRDNFAFLLFPLIGPFVTTIHGLIVRLKRMRKPDRID